MTKLHTHPTSHIFPKSTTSIIAPIFQPSIWQPVPNSGPKAIRETTILNHPVHPFKSTHYHPPSGSQNRFPDPYSARTSLEFQLKRAFFTEEGETNLRINPRFDLATHPVDIVRVFVMRSHCVRSIRMSIPRCLLRPPFTQLSLSTPSVETENPFKALTRDPLLCISFLPRFSFKEGGKGEFSLAISKNGSSFSRWKWKKGDGDGWRWFDPTGFETVWLRVLVIARNRMDDVCDWILVQFNPGLDSMNFLKGDAPLGIWGFAVVKSEFCAAA